MNTRDVPPAGAGRGGVLPARRETCAQLDKCARLHELHQSAELAVVGARDALAGLRYKDLARQRLHIAAHSLRGHFIRVRVRVGNSCEWVMCTLLRRRRQQCRAARAAAAACDREAQIAAAGRWLALFGHSL